VLPDRRSLELLRAGLLRGDDAQRAWEGWNAEVGLDHLDEGSFRLLPLVYRNLSRQGIRVPENNTLKGIYRKSWCKNQLLFHRIAAILASLNAVGVPTMALKGAALSRLHYRDDGVRPMRDVDVLVPIDRVHEAVALLEGTGWRRLTWTPDRLESGFLRFRHAIGYVRGDHEEFDLHWRSLFRANDPAWETSLWKGAVPLEIHGQRTLALDPTGQLIHACLHGMEANEIAPIRWIADAMAILESSEAIRWEFVVDFARRNRLQLFVGPALDYLVTTFGAPVPPDVLRRLAPGALSRSDVAEFQRVMFPDDDHGAVETLLALYRCHWRGSRDRGVGGVLLGFPAFLQLHCRLQSRGDLFRRSLRWSWRRVYGGGATFARQCE
jgi:hypothetical protein